MKTFVSVFLAALIAGALLINQQNRVRRWEVNTLAVIGNMERAADAVESSVTGEMQPRLDLLSLRIQISENHAGNAPLGSDTAPLLTAIHIAKRTKKAHTDELAEAKTRAEQAAADRINDARQRWISDAASACDKVTAASVMLRDGSPGSRDAAVKYLRDVTTSAEWLLKSERHGASATELETIVARANEMLAQAKP